MQMNADEVSHILQKVRDLAIVAAQQNELNRQRQPGQRPTLTLPAPPTALPGSLPGSTGPAQAAVAQKQPPAPATRQRDPDEPDSGAARYLYGAGAPLTVVDPTAWMEWKRRFLITAEYSRWTDLRRRKEAILSLQGDCEALLLDIPWQDPAYSFTELLRDCEQRIVPITYTLNHPEYSIVQAPLHPPRETPPSTTSGSSLHAPSPPRRLDSLDVTPPKKAKTSTSKAGGKKTVQCWDCGSPDHVWTDCRRRGARQEHITPPRQRIRDMMRARHLRRRQQEEQLLRRQEEDERHGCDCIHECQTNCACRHSCGRAS